MAQAQFGPPPDLIQPETLGTPLGGMGPYTGPPTDLITPPADLVAASPEPTRRTALENVGNLGLGVAQRAVDWTRGFVDFATTPVDVAADFLERALPLGTIDVGMNGISVRPTTEEELAHNPFITRELPKSGYKPMTTWEDVKNAPLSNVIPFALEQGIVSIPDMIGVMYSLPTYIAGRTGELGQQRAANDDRSQATVGDFLAAAPAAITSAMLERFGTEKILGADEVVRAFKEIPKAAGKAFLTEAGTEAAQEGVEYLGEQVGTKKGVSFSEGAERMLAAAIGGGPFGAVMRTASGAFQAWRSGQEGSAPPADIDPTPEEVAGFANSPEAQRAAEAVRRMQPAAADSAAPPPPTPRGAPAAGDEIGLKFPNAPSQRARVEGYFDNGESVRVVFDNGAKSDFLTEDLLRDLTEPPPPLREDVRGREASEGALSEAEAFNLFDEVPPPPNTRARPPQSPRLGAEAINALDQAAELERIAVSDKSLQTAQRTALMTQAAMLRQKYSVPAEPAAEPPRAVPAPTPAGPPQPDLGALDAAARANPALFVPRPDLEAPFRYEKPVDTVRIYRGEKAGERPTSTGSAATGGWFTTDPERAKTFGDVFYVDVTRDELKQFAAGAGRPDIDLVTTNPSFRQRMKPLQSATEPRDRRPPAPVQPELPPIVDMPDEYASRVKGRPEPPILATPNVPPQGVTAMVRAPVQGEGALEMARIVREADEAAAPVKVQERRAEVREPPRAKYARELVEIEKGLPPVAEGMTRMWRGNRPGEVGQNPSFTTDAPGIAMPFRDAYQGVLSYVDVPTKNLPLYARDPRGGSTDEEFDLPPNVAAAARPVRAPQAQTVNPQAQTPVPAQQNVPERSVEGKTEDKALTGVGTPQISREAAKQALRTNIDPRTGKRPQTKVALKTFRQEMRSIMTGKPIVKRVEKPTNTWQTDKDLYYIIRGMGGIRTRDANGKMTREGAEVMAVLKDVKYPGLINQKGAPPDRVREALRERGWFGVREDQGADIQDLYDALGQGRAFKHPQRRAPEPAPKEVEETPDRMAELEYKARQLGLQYPDNATEEELDAAITEREAMQEDNLDPIADERETEVQAKFAELRKLYDPLDAWSRAYDVANPTEVSGQPETAEEAAVEPERAWTGREREAEPPGAGEEAASRREDAVPQPRAEAQEEPGALDASGRALPQKVLAGAERSEEKSDAARMSAQRVRQKQELELRAKQSKMRRGGQESAGGMFAPERDQTDIFAPGSKRAPIALETKADVKAMNAAPIETAPSPAQIDAQNYKAVHVVYRGLPITLEHRKGDIRRSKPGAKVPWQVKMPFPYGYFKKSAGYDGDEVDVFVGDAPDLNTAFIIFQKDLETGKFDEHKVMLGFTSREDAVKAYSDSYSDGKGPDRIMSVQQLTVDDLKKRLNGKFFKTKPRDATSKVPTEFQQEMARRRAAQKERLDTAKRLFDRDGRVTATLNSRPDLRYVLTRSSDEGVAFRVTTIDKDGPSGHRNYNSFEEAVSQEFNADKTFQEGKPTVAAKDQIKPAKDPLADEAKSKDVQWFYPADFDIADDSENAERSTGWFYRGEDNRWQGPFPTSTAASEAAKPKPFTFNTFKAEVKKLLAGDMTAAEAKAAFERVLASENELKAELNGLNKTELAKMDPRNRNERKDVLVNSIYRDMVNSFNASGVYSYVMGQGDANAGIRKAMDKQTDADIQAAAEKRKARRAEMIQTITDPQTLGQFETFIRARGKDKLTAEQRERYDSLVADQTKNDQAREKAAANIVKKVDADATMSDVIVTKHSTKGHDLFVVQLSDRVPKDQYTALASAAKRLGGYYSSYRKDGAVPGFQFKTREAAEKFKQLREGDVSKQDIAEKRSAEVKENAVTRLRDMADKMEADADESMNRDRKTNTAKRAREAASAEADAAQAKALAITIRNIADAIEGGDVRYLDRIRTKADIEHLEKLVRNARTEWAMAQRDKSGERFEELSKRPLTREMIDNAKFPHPYTQRETLAKLGRFFANRPGMKRMAAEALKIAADLQRRDVWRFNAESLAEQEMLQVLAKAGLKEPDLKYESDNILETFTDNARITNMGLSNLPTLRAALREFLEHRGNAPKQDPIKVAERALIGTKIAGYFPTPPKVVDRLVELADVQPGQKMLEPEAGKGNIADRFRDAGANVDTIEVVPSLQNILKMKGHNVVGSDFMEHSEGGYDVIVMNPPFENRQDVDHVMHAYDLVKPGGKVVAVMSEGPFGSSDKKSTAFREWLEAVGGTSERLPQGAFLDSDRSTGVSTRVVRIIKGVSSAVTNFLKSESGTVGNQNPPEENDFNDDVADAMAEDNRSVPVGTYARAIARTQSGRGATATLGWIPKHFIEPRSLARKDWRSARFWNAIKAEDHEGSANINNYRDLARPYMALSEESRKKVNAVLELDRLENRPRRDDGRRVVVRNENQEEAELSRPGQSIRLTRPETDALHAVRRMFQKQWADLIRGTARKFGWDGEPSSAAILREAAGMSERDKKPLLRIADLLKALEEQERAGYVPLLRRGDYYIAVKRTGDPESLGGFPRVARFERLETSPGWEQLFGSVPGLKSRTQNGVPKAVAARLQELERKYPRADGFEIEHGDVSRNIDALRALDIPAIEKFLIAIEAKDNGLLGPMVEEARARLYEELKAGFKKRARTVPGYDPDFARSIGSYSHWIAFHVAQLIHGERVQQAYDETQKHPSRYVREFWQKWKQDDDAPMNVGDKVARGLTAAAFYYTMAANPSSAIVTFDAPLAARAVLSAGVGARKSQMPFNRSMADGIAALRANTKEGIHVDVMSMARDNAEGAFLKKMLEDGELGRTQELSTDFGALAEHQSQIFGEYRSQAKKALDISTSAFLATNEMSRAVTALTAFRLARNPQSFAQMDSAWSKNEVYREMVQRLGRSPETLARFLTTEAAFEWGRKNRAEWLGRHALGAVVWQFKQFPLKFLSVTKNLMLNMGAPGKAAAALLLASLWAYAGAQGLPFVQDVEKLFDYLTNELTGEDPQIRASLYRLLDNAGLGKVGADIVMRGPLSVLFGADVSNRFGFGDLVSQQQSATDFMGAAPSMFAQAIGGARRRYASGQSGLAVAAQLAPAAVRNPMQGFGVYPDEGAKTQTGTTMVKPEELTVADQVRRAMGFQPLRVSRAYDRMEHERRTRDASDVRVSRVYTQLTNLVEQQDEARAKKDGAAVMRIGARISEIVDKNADLGLTRRNVRMRLLQRRDPSAAALKLAPRRARQEMLDNPFPAP